MSQLYYGFSTPRDPDAPDKAAPSSPRTPDCAHSEALIRSTPGFDSET